MQAQKNNLDDLFKDTLFDYESAPVKLSWEQVATQLNERAVVKKKLGFYQLAAAAVILIGLSFSTYMYLQPEGSMLADREIKTAQKAASVKQNQTIVAAYPSIIKLESSKNKTVKTAKPRKKLAALRTGTEASKKMVQELPPNEESPLFASTSVLGREKEGQKEKEKERGNAVQGYPGLPLGVNTAEIPGGARKQITTTSIINNLVAKLDKRKDPFFKIEKRKNGDDETAMNYSVNLGFIKVKRTVN